MKNTKRKLKTIALMVAMAAGVLLPMKVSSQGLFNSSFGHSGSSGVSNSGFGQSGSGSNEVTNENFGQSDGKVLNQNFGKAPLGSGLLIMLAAGAGYAVLKRKKS